MTDETGGLPAPPGRGAGHVRMRLAVWADRDALIALVHAQRAEARRLAGEEPTGYWEDAAGVVEAHLTSSRRFYLIAEVDGVLVGFIQFSAHSDGIDVEAQYMAPRFRNGDLADRLRRRLEEGLHVE